MSETAKASPNNLIADRHRKSDKSSPTEASVAISISSGSSSNFESDSDSEIGSSQLPSKDAIVMSSRGKNVVNGTQSSHSSSALSLSSYENSLKGKISVNHTGKNQETFRKAQGTQPLSQSNKTSNKVGSDGMLSNGMKPANYRYPSLSQLKQEREGKSYRLPTKSPSRFPQKTKSMEDISLDSESDSDSSRSDSSEDGENEGKQKSNSGMLPGLRGILKRMLALTSLLMCFN